MYILDVIDEYTHMWILFANIWKRPSVTFSVCYTIEFY